MPTELRDEPTANRWTADDVDAAIRRHVLGALGRPADTHRVAVRRLWPDHYRVNVLVGADAMTTTIAHSYFVVADAAGAVTATTPAIVRAYRDGSLEGPARGRTLAEAEDGHG